MKKAVRHTIQTIQSSHTHGPRTTNVTPNKDRPSTLTNPNSQIKPICDNHHDKNATHRFFSQQSQEILYYCQKCSIMLASQGFNVEKLTDSIKDIGPNKLISSNQLIQNVNQIETPARKRLHQIQDFLQSLQKYLEILSVKYTEVQDTLVGSQQQYNKLMDHISSYYDSLQQILQLQKYLSYNALLTRRNSQETQLRNVRQNVKGSIIQIQDMMNDVQNNLDAVQGVQQQIYLSIMQGYNQKLETIPQIIKYQFKIPEQYNIMIPEIPDVLSSLSQKFMLYPKPKGKTPNQPSKFSNHQFEIKTRSKSKERSREIKQFYSHYSNHSNNVHIVGSKQSGKSNKSSSGFLQKSNSDYLQQKQRKALGEIINHEINSNIQQQSQFQPPVGGFYKNEIVNQYPIKYSRQSGQNYFLHQQELQQQEEQQQNLGYSFEQQQ